MALGEKIQRARELRGLSRQELADLIGVDPKTVRNWETGHTTNISRALMRALEQVLGPLDAAVDDAALVASVLATLADSVRTSDDLPPATKQALLRIMQGQPAGRHALIPYLSEP